MMARVLGKAALVLAAAMLAVVAAATMAAFAAGHSLDIGSLSNRYERIETSDQQADTTENVVVTTRIGVLAAANRALDESTVSFSGEVVGDIMNADADHKWVNVLGSDGSCIGVLVDNTMAERIKNVGDYSTTGTTLQVRGIYSIDCDEHQGELDVHAVDVRVLDSGGRVEHFVSETDVNLGLQLCLVGLVLIAAFFVGRWYFVHRDLRKLED